MSFCFKEFLEKILSSKKIFKENTIEKTSLKLWANELIVFLSYIESEDLRFKIIDFLMKPSYESLEQIESLSKEHFGKKIFVVYGRNERYFKIVQWCLKIFKFDCDFLGIFNDSVGTQFIFETLIKKISSSFKVIVIASADDIGKLDGSDEDFTFRPRLNVVLEAGLSYGILSADNVLLLWDDQISFEKISDLQGALKLLTTIKTSSKEFIWIEKLKKKIEEFNKEWDRLYCIKDERNS